MGTGKKAGEADFGDKCASPRYGSLKYGQLDEPVTVEDYKQHYLDMRSEEDQSFLFDMFFKGTPSFSFLITSHHLHLL